MEVEMKIEEFLKHLVPVPNPEEYEKDLPDSKIFYFDESGNSTDKDGAKSVIIAEYNDKGEVVRETWGTIGDNSNKKTR